MKRTILAVLVAAVLALIGCAAVLLYVKGADNRALDGKKAVMVLIASKRVPAGTTGAEVKNGGYVERVKMPKSTVPADAIDQIDASLDELALSSDLQPRQLVLRGLFGQPATVTGGLNIPDGKVAVTVPVLTSAGTAFLQPGSKIAIYDTYTLLEGKKGEPAGAKIESEHTMNHNTKLLLPKVEVIATGIGGKIVASNTDKKDDASATSDAEDSSADTAEMTLVTVAATQDEAERLIHVAQTGTLYIALLDDSSNLQPGPGVDNSTLFN